MTTHACLVLHISTNPAWIVELRHNEYRTWGVYVLVEDVSIEVCEIQKPDVLLAIAITRTVAAYYAGVMDVKQ